MKQDRSSDIRFQMKPYKTYTSDFSGEFLVTVEGLTKDGKIISGTVSFKVW